MSLQRLKNKLGTRQLPTAELLLDGSLAHKVSSVFSYLQCRLQKFPHDHHVILCLKFLSLACSWLVLMLQSFSTMLYTGLWLPSLLSVQRFSFFLNILSTVDRTSSFCLVEPQILGKVQLILCLHILSPDVFTPAWMTKFFSFRVAFFRHNRVLLHMANHTKMYITFVKYFSDVR